MQRAVVERGVDAGDEIVAHPWLLDVEASRLTSLRAGNSAFSIFRVARLRGAGAFSPASSGPTPNLFSSARVASKIVQPAALQSASCTTGRRRLFAIRIYVFNPMRSRSTCCPVVCGYIAGLSRRYHLLLSRGSCEKKKLADIRHILPFFEKNLSNFGGDLIHFFNSLIDRAFERTLDIRLSGTQSVCGDVQLQPPEAFRTHSAAVSLYTREAKG